MSHVSQRASPWPRGILLDIISCSSPLAVLLLHKSHSLNRGLLVLEARVELQSVSHLLHMTFVLGLCGSLCHPCFVKPAPPCEPACSPSYRTSVLFLADM